MNIKAAIQQMAKTRKCAVESGVYPHMFPAYGSLLGYVRDDNLIKHDDDVDFVVLSDRITEEQEKDYYRLLRERGLFVARDKLAVHGETGRMLWHSMKEAWGKKGCKACTWYFFEHAGFYWHSKAKIWVRKIGDRLRPKPNMKSAAIAKGIPAKLFSHMVERDFCGMKWYFPVKYGKICDLWYEGWKVPKKGGASLEEMLMIIGKWKKKDTWQIRRR